MKSRRGFTLVEVMITVAIIAIVSAVVVPNYVSYKRTSERNICIANMKHILNAQEAFCMAKGRYASEISDLCGLSSLHFFKEMPRCPCGGTYRYYEPIFGQGSRVTCTGGIYADGYAHTLESTGGIVDDD